MKVILLSADSELQEKSHVGPRCLTQFVGKVTLLERQLRVLALCGIKRSDIIIVIGSKGVWDDESAKKTVESFGCTLCINNFNTTSNSGYSLFLALEQVSSNGQCLVISGDVNFEVKHLEVLLANDGENVAFARKALAVGEKGLLLNTSGNVITDVGPSISIPDFPWYIFCGILLISPTLISKYRMDHKKSFKLSYIEAAYKIKGEEFITFIDYVRPISGENAVNSVTRDLSGGSYANLNKRYLVRKQAEGEGRQKLLDEINWLLSLPKKLENYFPKIVDYKKDGDNIWFDMPWYDLNNIRKNILTGQYDANEVILFLNQVLDFVFLKLYPNVIGDVPDDWVKNKHLDRVSLRLKQCYQRTEVFRPVMKAESIVINGITYSNLPHLFLKIRECNEIEELFKPDHLRMIHGDLHFQNILVNENGKNSGFILADPRGEMLGSDIYYDLGKLWHSFNGMYDLIHTDQVNVVCNFKDGDNQILVDMQLGNSDLLQTYSEIHKLVQDRIQKYDLIMNDKHWLLKTKFAEAMHFSSVMPFHLLYDSKENRSLTLYFVAVRLMSELIDELKPFLKTHNITLKDDKTINELHKEFISEIKF